MSDKPHADELEPEHTEGFKVGEKKTIDEYQQLGKWPAPASSSESPEDQSIQRCHAGSLSRGDVCSGRLCSPQAFWR